MIIPYSFPRLQDQRSPNLCPTLVGFTEKPHNAHHSELRSVEQNCFADDVGVAAKFVLPECVGQDCHFIVLRLLLLREKAAPKEKLTAQHIEEIRRNLETLNKLRFTSPGEIAA